LTSHLGFSIDEFVYNLRDFIDTVQLDHAVVTECTYIVKEFALSTTIYGKFEEIWTKLGIKDR
jgi:hypothetical protein